MVLVFAPEKTDTAAACAFDPAASVNVGLLAVAVSVGASLTAVTVTVDAIDSVVVSAPLLAVPPLSWIWVSVKVRAPAVGLSVLVSWYVMPLTSVLILAADTPPALLSAMVAVPPTIVTV